MKSQSALCKETQEIQYCEFYYYYWFRSNYNDDDDEERSNMLALFPRRFSGSPLSIKLIIFFNFLRYV